MLGNLRDSLRVFGIWIRHPHPTGQEVAHQALHLLTEFGEVVITGVDAEIGSVQQFADGSGIGDDAIH